MGKTKTFSKKLRRINKVDIFFLVSKISIIVFVSIWLIGNFQPFYNGADSKLYGVSAIDLANGEFGFSNELLLQTGEWEFIPNQYVKTIHNTAIPAGSFGIYGISAVTYLVSGLYGLFYFGPLMTIICIISSERIATYLFGRGAGLVALLVIATDTSFLKNGLNLLTDISFSLFFILGCYYLITFLKHKKNISILSCSIFFVIASFIKLNGIIALPLTILIVIGYFCFQIFVKNKNKSNRNSFFVRKFFSKIGKKNFVQKSLFLIIPWIVFLVIIFNYNEYFFGDPLIFYNDVSPAAEQLRDGTRSSFFTFDLERFEWIKFYLTGFLPDEIFENLRNLSTGTQTWKPTYNWFGLITLIILVLGLGISLIKKVKRTEIIILALFSLSFPLFHSMSYLHYYNYFDADASFQTGERYMIPSFILSVLILSYLIEKLWRVGFKNNLTLKGKKYIIFSVPIVFILVSFFFISINNSPPMEYLKSSSFELKDPNDFINWFPIDNEGISEKSIIIGSKLRRGIEYDAVLFNPFWMGFNHQAPEKTPQKPIQLLKESIGLGYQVYTFKDIRFTEREYIRYLIDEHDFIIKDFSKIFCKLELIENNKLNNSSNSESFNTCLIIKKINTN